MRRIGWIAATVVFAPFALSVRSPAQQPIQVARHSPLDTARAGDVITVSFNRPVAGSVERSARPERFVRIDPPIKAKVEWRDLVTLRVIPDEPLPPGRRFHITVDTSFTALDGGRLEAPYQFTILTAGPRYLGSIPSLAVLEPPGQVTLVYSAAIDSALFANAARVEIDSASKCDRRVIRFAVSQRAVDDTDGHEIQSFGESSDEVDGRFRHVVMLTPRAPMPEGCRGSIVVPSIDPNDPVEIRYPIVTAAPFMVATLSCQATDCAASRALTLTLTGSVYRDSVLRRIHLDPAVPFTIPESDSPSSQWSLQLAITPRTTYRVTVDSTLRDVFGRPLQARTTASVYVGDRQSAMGHQLGFFTVSRHHPVLRVTHVNIDSARLAFVPVPEAMRTSVLFAMSDPDSVARMISRFPDSVNVHVALPARHNEERITEIPIPRVLLERYAGALIAIRARSTSSTHPPSDSADRGSRKVNRTEAVKIITIGRELTNRVAVVQVTDLAVHARVSNEPGAVFVTDINTGRPVAGASVTVRDTHGLEMSVGTTDSSGVGRLRTTPGWRPFVRTWSDESWSPWADRFWDGNRARLIDVRLRDDRSVVRITPEPWTDPNESATGGEQADVPMQLVRALAYTDRAIYRPGERVYLGVIARHRWQGELKPLAEHDSLRLSVADVDDDPDVVRDTIVRVDRFGTAADSFTLATGAALGNYVARVAVMTSGGWRPRAFASFRVAEYRAPQFRASLVIDSGARFIGDTIRARATGSYYFGATMAGAPVHWMTKTEAVNGVDIPGLPEGFIVARRYRESWGQDEAGDELFGTDTLDVRGTARLTMPTARGDLIGPARLTTHIAVADFDRRTAAATESTILHSSSFYIAVRDSGAGWYWRQGRPRVLDVLAVAPTGRRLAGMRISLTTIRRYAAWSVSAYGGLGGMWRWAADTVGRDSVVSADSILHVAVTPSRDGSYEVAFTAHDEQGRPVATSLGAYVIPPQWSGGWGLDPASLAIRLARDTVAPGDSARVSVVSPFRRAEAWVTVEREGILAQLRRTVGQGETTFKIPVDARFIPGAQVSVLLVNATPAWKTDTTHKRIRSASVPLTVDRSSKSITVQLETSASSYAPGDSARLTVRLRDRGGRPVVGKVAVWAVDESVLALTDSTRLSPLDSMYADPWSRFAFASTAPTLASLGRILAPSGWVRLRDPFGDAPAHGAIVETLVQRNSMIVALAPRTDFRTTAFYLASLETDADGIARASVKLPENLTTYRVISMAVDAGDRFGAAETAFTITKPLIARSALPRFMRTGDTFSAGAVITNQTGAALSSTVTASARAVVLEADKPVERLLQNGVSSEARFAWKATAAPGDTASLLFTVNGGSRGDAVETPVVVRAPYSPRFHAIAGVARGSAMVRLMLPSGIDPARSRLTLRVGTTPVTTIRTAYDRLVVYPFACSEQLASRARATIAMLRLASAGVLDSATGPHPAELRDELQWIADELVRRQTRDGAIGYWSGTSWSTGPLSMYAGFALLDARDLGIAVRPVVLQRIADYLKEGLEKSPALPDSVDGTPAERRARAASRLGARLAALHYLRRFGQPDEVRENELLNFAGQMVWEDRVWLTELVTLRGDRPQASRMLTAVWRDVEIAGTRVDIPDSLLDSFGFRSHVRPVARLLRATLRIDPDHPRLPLLVERVVQQGAAVGDRLWNTHDYAAAADALVEVALWQRTSGAGGTVTVRSALGGADAPTLLKKVVGQSADTSVLLRGLVKHEGEWTVLPLQISGGDVQVFYALTVEEVPLEPPTTPDAKGIVVERWYERFDDGRPVSEVTEGELVRARLRITVPSDREFVAIADPLPAGLEAVDLSLRTSRTIGPFESVESREAEQSRDRANRGAGGYYGGWSGGWWSPWEHHEIRDDRVTYFARILWKGTYTASYVARATTAGTFIRPPAHAEEMYNPSLGGRSEGGVFRVIPR